MVAVCTPEAEREDVQGCLVRSVHGTPAVAWMSGMLQLGLVLLPPTQSDPRMGAQQWSLGLPVAVRGQRWHLVTRIGAKPQLPQSSEWP
jgi:hypothetical protein